MAKINPLIVIVEQYLNTGILNYERIGLKVGLTKKGLANFISYYKIKRKKVKK